MSERISIEIALKEAVCDRLMRFILQEQCENYQVEPQRTIGNETHCCPCIFKLHEEIINKSILIITMNITGHFFHRFEGQR